MATITLFLKNHERKILWLVFVALYFYLVLRAVYTPILHDEIATFYYYIQTGVYFPPEAHWDANNHILNSLLSNWSFQAFGSEPWALRLPNVLSFPLFFLFSWKLLQNIQHLGLKWSAFLALVMCHYLFEYFGETRGYGLSMAFLVMGLYFALSYVKTQKIWLTLAAMLSLFLAVAANLTIIYIYLMVLTLLCVAIRNQSKSLKTKLLESSALLVISGIIAAPLVQFSLDLKERGALYYGGKSSFIEYTVTTLSDLILGSKHSIVLGLIIFLSIILLVFTLKQLLAHRTQLFQVVLEEKLFYALLFFGSLTAIFATRYLLDVNFPEDRTALYLYPLFVLSLAFTLENVTKNRARMQFSVAVLFVYLPIHFIWKTDISQASFSMEERAPQEYFDIIHSASSNAVFKPTVGGYTTQNLCWYYMNYQAGGQHNAMLFSSYPDTLCDFQILNVKTVLPKNFRDNYRQINEEPINDLNLYQRTKNLRRVLLAEVASFTNWTHQSDEFFNLLEYDITDADLNSAVLAEISGVFHAPNSPFQGTITISQKKANGEEISQERFVLNWLKERWTDDQYRFHQVLVLPNIDPEARLIQIFVWNIKGKPYLVKAMDLRLYRLE